MPTLVCALAGIYGCGIYPSFSLERKVSEKFKAASIGPPRGCLNA